MKAKKFCVKVRSQAGRIVEHITLVDAEDAHYMRSSYWTVSAGSPNAKTDERFFYVIRHARSGIEFLHRIVVGAEGEEKVFHINGNSLDNRKANLMRQSERVVEIE
jgi:hypothetical protein